MQLMTVLEYARFKNISHQAVYDRIKRGTLKPVYEKVDVMKIPVEDTELAEVKGK